MAYFQSVEGSMTSKDGKTFMLHVKRETGSDLLEAASRALAKAMVDDAGNLPKLPDAKRGSQ